MERKAVPALAIKVNAEQGVVEHIVSVMGNVDLGNDRIMPGAFTKTIAERGPRIRVLDQHNTDSVLRVLGKPLELREIGQAELPAELVAAFPDATAALWVKTQFLLDTPEGMGAFQRIKAGALDEWSIGIDPLDITFEKAVVNGKATTVRSIRTVKLYEYSPVLWGMNPATATLDVKAPKQEAEVSDQKELSGGVPLRRLGDQLAAGVLSAGLSTLTYWLGDGYLSREAYTQAASAVQTAVDQIIGALPPDVADLELPSYDMMDMLMMMAARGGAETKQGDGPTESKKGRVFSAAHETLLRSAYDALGALLSKLPEVADDEESTPSEDAKASPEPAEPTAEVGPSADTHLAQRDAATRGYLEASIAEIDSMLAEVS